MDKKFYSSAQRDSVLGWADKWFELTSLIIEVTGTDGPLWLLLPPTELDELNYQRLHFQPIDHETQFVPLQSDFYECQDWALQQDDDEIVDIPDIDWVY